ncbi:hypothetical protein ATKI12_8178 [Kitasatospora sp. Ki12]
MSRCPHRATTGNRCKAGGRWTKLSVAADPTGPPPPRGRRTVTTPVVTTPQPHAEENRR